MKMAELSAKGISTKGGYQIQARHVFVEIHQLYLYFISGFCFVLLLSYSTVSSSKPNGWDWKQFQIHLRLHCQGFSFIYLLLILLLLFVLLFVLCYNVFGYRENEGKQERKKERKRARESFLICGTCFKSVKGPKIGPFSMETIKAWIFGDMCKWKAIQ